jgi:hypothetical protein
LSSKGDKNEGTTYFEKANLKKSTSYTRRREERRFTLPRSAKKDSPAGTRGSSRGKNNRVLIENVYIGEGKLRKIDSLHTRVLTATRVVR